MMHIVADGFARVEATLRASAGELQEKAGAALKRAMTGRGRICIEQTGLWRLFR
ncbi:hypothetical protein [Lysobacter sp. Root667]|uniref:hypothetical protein n=1 Tax=Lysobacter sp. Root667 TaxID=1736581 RepID=UPI0012DF481C|nr:hypothetical protein [Lysobacter sp. Root667]